MIRLTKKRTPLSPIPTLRFTATLALSLIAAIPSQSVLAADEAPIAVGDITLPLERYAELLSDIERADAERLNRDLASEPILAAITRAESTLTIDDDGIVGRAVFEVSVSGQELSPVPLPVTGLVTSGSVEGNGASLSFRDEAPVVLPERPGSFRIVLETALAFPTDRAALRVVPLPATHTPVASLVLQFDADLDWSCPEASVVRNEVADEQRTLELALPNGVATALALRSGVSARSDRTVVKASTATAIDIGRHGISRTDVAAFEVLRGQLASFDLTLPPSLDPDTVWSDEGVAAVQRNGSELLVFRETVLEAGGPQSQGYVRVNTSLELDQEVDLQPIDSGYEERDHYLLVRTSAPANVAPRHAEHWERLDISDLPPALASSFGDAKTFTLWRRRTTSKAPLLDVDLMPEAPDLGAVVRLRDTTSLLTVDGSLVHREVLQIVGRSSALKLTLPAGSEFWSLLIDGQPGRPLISAGTIYVPLSLANDGVRTVELVSVQEQAVPDGRTQIGLELAMLEQRVLEHRWRLLLPEGRRYRYASGTLRPTMEVAARSEPKGSLTHSGSSFVTGVVRDRSGVPLPGVTVTIRGELGSLTAISDASGRYLFDNLPQGRFRVSAALEGFGSKDLAVGLERERGAKADLELALAVTESITVTSEAPMIDKFTVQESFRDERKLRQKAAYQSEAQLLRAGRVAGVRPLPVVIPEDGKVLELVGVLPTTNVSVLLDVRKGRAR